ncbi:hypothetical protein ARALYDRAFT_914610 [Arabidopsis lyrata subsp. lyrata]|uniref:Leucine-rich repeat family protein n=1 Tax=Arabidopsis lyrata subsp. lyrata TaxID=81972 RepID=D7MFI9_ARALL|nr:hypothetical protein ARALYDRAFT_914610 [Arabidopsis lyrata subsp. lyrata]
MADTVPIRTSTKCDVSCSLDLTRTKSSTLPPSCNAIEVFGVLQLLQSETDKNDDFSNFGLNGTISRDIQYLNQLQKLNLSGNNLSGSIPQSLRNMANNGLTLLANGNPNLCLDPSCESEAGHGNNIKKLLVPILASAASVGIITAVLLLIILFFRKKRPQKGKLEDK